MIKANLPIFGIPANLISLSSEIGFSLDVMFPPDVYASGEVLFENKSVLEISKGEANTYSVFIKDGDIYEVELFKPFTKQQKFRCECGVFEQDKSCKHLVAALLGYKDLKQPDKIKKTGKPRTLNINSLLLHIDAVELEAFVKSYALKDKKFANALKIHFARKVELENNQEKYRLILDGLVKPVTGTGMKANSKTDLKVFGQVIDDFLAQAEDALVLQDFVEAFYIIKAAIVKSAYVFKHFGEKIPLGFYKNYHGLHHCLNKLLEQKPAPHLLLEIQDFIKSTLELSYYELLTPTHNLISTGLDFDILDINYARESLDQRIKNSKNEQEIPIVYAVKIKYFGSNVDIESRHAIHTGRITQLLMDNANQEMAFEFLKENISRKTDSDLVRQYLNLLVRRDGEAAYLEVAHYFMEYKDLRFFDVVEKRGKEHLQTLVNLIQSHKDYKALELSFHFPYYLAKIGDFDGLLSYLNNNPSLDLLMRFDKILYDHRPNLITVMYENLVHEYLNNHVGDQSLAFVNNIYSHLYKIGATKIVKRIQEMVEEDFKYRSGK